MLFDYIDTSLNVQLLFGLTLGLLFGVCAQITRFCLRRSIAGEDGPDYAGLSVWLLALGVAILTFSIAESFGLIDLGGHRFLNSDVPVLSILMGGIAFGVGMVLTRGCATRLTILAASGNLRSVTVLAVFAITAHATLKGVLTPVRAVFGEATVALPVGSLSEFAVLPFLIGGGVVAAAVSLAIRSRTQAMHLALGAFIGLLIVLGWAGTSVVLMDEFDPQPVQSLAFTQPWADSLFYALASTAIEPGFGAGLIGGVLIGAFLSALARRETALVSFTTPAETLRYGAGGMLMGVGGVLAGGCTIGAGLSGVSTLSVSAILALFAIVAGALIARLVLAGSFAKAAAA